MSVCRVLTTEGLFHNGLFSFGVQIFVTNELSVIFKRIISGVESVNAMCFVLWC